MTNITHIIQLERRYYMSFFDVILVSSVGVLFPLLIYLICLAYMNITNDGKKINDSIFELVLLSTIFLIIRLTNGKYNNYTIVLMNIPLLFSYIRDNKKIAIFISIGLILYFHSVLNYNIIFLLIEYISYFIIHLFFHRRDGSSKNTIDWFTLTKALFFSIYIYYLNINSSFLLIFSRVFLLMIVFYFCSNIYYFLLIKGEEIIELNNSLKILEKELLYVKDI